MLFWRKEGQRKANKKYSIKATLKLCKLYKLLTLSLHGEVHQLFLTLKIQEVVYYLEFLFEAFSFVGFHDETFPTYPPTSLAIPFPSWKAYSSPLGF